jgi:hypothetical protein
MKLFQDFEIRGLIALLTTLIYGAGLLYTLVQRDYDGMKLFAAIFGQPWIGYMSWYFTTRVMQRSSHGA